MPSEFGSAKQILDNWTQDRIFTGASLLIQKDGEILLEFASGWSDQNQKIPANVNQIWVTASLRSMVEPA